MTNPHERVKLQELHPAVAEIIRAKTRRMVTRMRSLAQEREDIEQELYLHWLERAEEYDPQLGTLQAFAATVITNRLRNYLRDAARRQSRECVTDQFDHVATASPEGQTRSDITDLCALLPARFRKLIDQLQVATIAEIANQSGCSRYAIYRRLKEIREYLEESMEIFENPVTNRNPQV